MNILSIFFEYRYLPWKIKKNVAELFSWESKNILRNMLHFFKKIKGKSTKM